MKAVDKDEWTSWSLVFQGMLPDRFWGHQVLYSHLIGDSVARVKAEGESGVRKLELPLSQLPSLGTDGYLVNDLDNSCRLCSVLASVHLIFLFICSSLDKVHFERIFLTLHAVRETKPGESWYLRPLTERM